MSGLNKKERRQAAEACDEEQRKLYENAGAPYPGRVCEVRRAREFGDVEYLKEKWSDGDCSPEIILDHIDNNDDNNPSDGSNWQWLCRCHNVKKDPPHDRSARHKYKEINKSEHYMEKGKGRRVYGRKDLGSENKFWNGGDVLIVRSMEMAKNMACQPMFKVIIKKIMRRYGEAKWNKLIDAGMQDTRVVLHDGTVLTIGVKAAEGYLRALTSDLSSTAPFKFEIIGGEKVVKWRKEQKKKAHIPVVPPQEGIIDEKTQ